MKIQKPSRDLLRRTRQRGSYQVVVIIDPIVETDVDFEELTHLPPALPQRAEHQATDDTSNDLAEGREV
jgi:hypothetical protein